MTTTTPDRTELAEFEVIVTADIDSLGDDARCVTNDGAPASHRIVNLCGCSFLICGQHAELVRAAINTIIARGKPHPCTCRTCDLRFDARQMNVVEV